MKFSASALLLSAAIGASAHPSGHAHRHAHRSVEARDFFMAKKPAPILPPPSELAPPPAAAAVEPTPEPAAPSPEPAPPAPKEESPKEEAPAPASTSSSSSSGSGVSEYTPFCGGKKRATVAQIAYQGNIGTSGDYGCNMMTVKSDIADEYTYTIKFVNAGSSSQECSCWNKIGKDLGINGFFSGNEAVTFNLPGHGEQYVAFDKNSQGGCACGEGSVPLTSFGQFASTWAEYDFGNESNGGWSGYDASCLVSAKYGLNIPGLNLCDDKGTCSTINAGGTGTNAYLGGMEDLDGVGGNLVPGKVRLTATVNY
jgi:hypothetical protein